MGILSSKLRNVRTSNGNGVAFWCPGCEEHHHVTTEGTSGPVWRWDGSIDAPTFSPSVLVTSGHYSSLHKPGDPCWCTYNREDRVENPARIFQCTRCHSFVERGQIQFLNDCTHALAGRTVPMPDLPGEE